MNGNLMNNALNDKINPYIDAEGKYELSNSVIAFIDIIGFKERVRAAKINGKSEQLFTEFQNVLKDVDDLLQDIFAKYCYELTNGESEIKSRYKFRIFTDCIVIACPIRDSYHHDTLIKGLDGFSEILETASVIQCELICRGFFVRGAITVDELYMDEMTIYGVGLIDAYEAESKHAKYPRIILTEAAQAMFKEINNLFQVNDYKNYLNKHLYIDSDGVYFLNYLQYINMPDEPFLGVLEKHKELIEKKLFEYVGKPNILEKYVWGAIYHNLFCHLDANDEYRIDLAQYQMRSL